MKRWLSAVCAPLPLLSVALGAQQLPQQAMTFDLPARPIIPAIRALGRATGLHMLVSNEVVPSSSKQMAPEIKGYMTLTVALDCLLTPLGLTYRVIRAREIKIERAVLPSTLQPVSEARTGSTEADVTQKEVVVTGSHIRGVAPLGFTTTSYPSDIEASGALTIQEFLSEMPQSFGDGATGFASSVVSPAANRSNVASGRTVNLRGLGPRASLVLVNGMQPPLIAAGGETYFDLSMIPTRIVERIDVRPEGESAVYGSDAIAGTVNIVLDRQFTGSLVEAQIGQQKAHGGTVAHTTLIHGMKWQEGHGEIVYDFRDQTAVDALDRLATRNVSEAGWFSADLTPDIKHHVLYLAADQSPAAGVKVSLDALGMTRAAESGSSSIAFGGMDARSLTQTSVYAAALQLEYSLRGSWQMHLDAGVSESDVDAHLAQTIRQTDQSITTRGRTHFRSRFANLHAQGELLELPAGAMRVAAGWGLRFDEYGSDQPPEGSLTMRTLDAFVEGFAPLVPPPEISSGAGAASRSALELSFSARYETTGRVHSTVPKVTLRWTPWQALELYTSYGHSFKLPGLDQSTLLGSSESLQSVSDPRKPGDTIRVLARFGTNPDLSAERARTWSAGMAFTEPFSQARFGIAYFDIDYRYRIDSIHAELSELIVQPDYVRERTLRTDLSRADFNSRVAPLLTSPPNNVVSGCRTPGYSSGACDESADDVDAILDLRYRNVARTRTNGFDVTIDKAIELQSAVWDFSLRSTHILRFESQATRTAPRVELLDTIFNPRAWKLRAGAGVTVGSWGAHVFMNYGNRYDNNDVAPEATIAATTTFDLSIRYLGGVASQSRWLDGFQAALTLTNLLDARAPFADNASHNGFAFDPHNANPEGLRIAFSLSKHW